MLKLEDKIDYDPETGIFRWKVAGNNRVVGRRAGYTKIGDYTLIRVDRILYRGGRLAWYLTYGYWPEEIDHINRIKSDDRLCNLREVTYSKNGANTQVKTKSGIKGIYQTKEGNWQVYIGRNYVMHCVGTFATLEGAKEARRAFLESRGETVTEP